MNVNSIQSSEQVSEQYKIRAKRQEQTAQQIQESQQAEQAQQLQQAQQVQAQQVQQAQEVDTYDKENPVGVQAEGVYSLSHDEEGNLTVNYTQPASKSDSTDSTESAQGAKAESSQQAGTSAGASSVASTSSDDDEELEELQQQRDAIRQQLNRETDENVKAQLRVQLQSIETQIALKSAGIDA